MLDEPKSKIQDRLHIDAISLLKALDLANNFTIRNLRGVISEYYLRNYLLSLGLEILAVEQNDPFDFRIKVNNQTMTIQLKLQRQIDNRPALSQEVSKKIQKNLYVAEIQRARNGFHKNGESTRPYKFTDFDILAVCLEPLNKNWGEFIFAKTKDLIPDSKHPNNIFKYQPIEINKDSKAWNRDLLEILNVTKI